MPVYRTLNHNFFTSWSADMAYVLGFFAADGSMIKNNRGAHFIEFNTIDKESLLLIQKAVSSNHAIVGRKRLPRHSTVYRLQLGSKKMFQDLEKLGFTQAKSNTLKMPSVPQEFVGNFVRGYFDGDGCVYFKKLKFADRKRPRWIFQTIFTSGNKKFLIELHYSLQKYGVRGGSLRVKNRGFDLSLSFRDSVALYEFMYHTGTGSLLLKRKYSLFRKAIATLYPTELRE